MKKIVLVLAIILSTAMASNAFIDNQYMATEQFVVNTGYSSDVAKLMTITNQDPYRPMHTDNDERTPLDIARKVYNYIAPGMYTDYDFFNHSIKNNTVDWRDF